MNKRGGMIGVALGIIASTSLLGCNDPNKVVFEEGEQLKLRSMQSRRFDTTDKNKTLRTAMATLQDLGFVIDEADETLGTVSATKLDRYALRMTITVKPYSQEQLVVRANAQYNLRAVEDPETYQHFFDAFSKAMFLTAHNIE